jgi:hypothetical protein
MDLAQLVHLGPHGRAAVAEQLGANAEFFRNRQIFVTQGSHLREDRQQLDALFGQLDALLLVGGVVHAGDDALVEQCLQTVGEDV